MRRIARHILGFLGLGFLGGGLFVASALAHDIPNDVTVQAFVRPAGQRMQLLVRVPMAALRDIDFPTNGPGYLDLSRVGPLLPDASTLWVSDAVELYENDTSLGKPRVVATRVSLQSDRSFTSFDTALANVTGAPLPVSTSVYWNQAMLDVLFEYPIQSDQSRFSIRPEFGRLGVHVVTVVRFLAPNTPVRAFEFTEDPGLVRLDPRWYQAALRFVDLGFFHILDGTDHLLFLFCLVIPFRSFRGLIPIVTAFTVAHSMTLIASAYNLAPDALWFPPLIETLIAVSIVYMALENIAGGATVNTQRLVAGIDQREISRGGQAGREPADPRGEHLDGRLLTGGRSREWRSGSAPEMTKKPMRAIAGAMRNARWRNRSVMAGTMPERAPGLKREVRIHVSSRIEAWRCAHG